MSKKVLIIGSESERMKFLARSKQYWFKVISAYDGSASPCSVNVSLNLTTNPFMPAGYVACHHAAVERDCDAPNK